MKNEDKNSPMSESTKSKLQERKELANTVYISTLSHHAVWRDERDMYVVQSKYEIGTKYQYEMLSQEETVLVPALELRYVAKAPLPILRNITVRVYRRLPKLWQEHDQLNSPVGTLCVEVSYELRVKVDITLISLLQRLCTAIIREQGRIVISPFHGR